MHRLLATALVAATLAMGPGNTAHAQQFPIPGKTIRIIVPFGAGGGADHQARVIGQRLSEALGLPVIIDNRPGASSLIGTREVQRAEPDGHTLLYQISTIVQLPLMSRRPPWDVFTDFTPITIAARSYTVLTAHSSAPFNTVGELVDFARKNPGKLSYASFGVGTTAHLNGELLKKLAEVDIVHIPYKASSEAARDHMSGNVILSFDGPTIAIPNVASGRVKFLGVAAEVRSSALPDVPTLREQGYDVGRQALNGFWGPPGMSPAVVEAVYTQLAKVISRPDVKEIFAKVGNETAGMPPAEMISEVRSMHNYWAATIERIGVKLD